MILPAFYLELVELSFFSYKENPTLKIFGQTSCKIQPICQASCVVNPMEPAPHPHPPPVIQKDYFNHFLQDDKKVAFAKALPVLYWIY